MNNFKGINIIYLKQNFYICNIYYDMEKYIPKKTELSENVQKAMKGKNVEVSGVPEKEKYSKRQYIQIYKGYDFMENFLVVRSYIQRRYDIDLRMLEILLKLMGLKMFTREEYSALPKQFTFNKFKSIIESGFISILSDHYDVEKRIFTLNTKGRNIIINFYKYLSGEKKIPEDYYNPMVSAKTRKPFDKKKVELIKKLNKMSIKEHNKKLFH